MRESMRMHPGLVRVMPLTAAGLQGTRQHTMLQTCSQPVSMQKCSLFFADLFDTK